MTTLSLAQRTLARDRAVQAALLGLHHAPAIHYTQGAERWEGISKHKVARKGQFPTHADCSAFATWCLWNGLHLGLGVKADVVNGESWNAGYCVPTDADCLTRRGWVAWNELRPGEDETIGYNPETQRAEWTQVESVHVFDDQETVRLSARGWEAVVTPQHKWSTNRLAYLKWSEPLHDRAPDGRFARASLAVAAPPRERVREDVLLPHRDMARDDYIRLAAPTADGTLPITVDEAAVLGWLACEGHVRSKSYGKSRALQRAGLGGNPRTDALSPDEWGDRIGRATIYQAKPEGLVALRGLLAGVPHKERARKCLRPTPAGGTQNYPEHTFTLNPAWIRDLCLRARFPDGGLLGVVLNMSGAARQAFLDACLAADGHTRSRTRTGADGYTRTGSEAAFVQRPGTVLEAVKLAAYLTGRRPGRTSERNGCAEMRLCDPLVRAEAVRSEPAPRQTMWCPHTGLNTWTMRWRGQVMLTGNTGTMAQHGREVLHLRHVLPGDCVLYGPAPTFEHVAIVVAVRNGVPMVVSHGSEPGPFLLPYNYRRDVGQFRRYVLKEI